MSAEVTRRAFLFGIIGAAAAGWVWTRSRGLPTDPAPTTTSVQASPSSTTTTSTPATTVTTTVAPTTSTSTTTSTTLVPVRMELICREAWGARPPTGEFTSHQLERLTVHHTARLLRQNSDAPRSIRIHQDFHQVDRGWPDIAYHFLIDLDGNVYEGRPPSAVGDTGTNYDPTGHFLVSCEGNFNEQELPAAQRDALVNVLAWASEAFSIDPTTLAGHRDVASTTCPGDNLYALIESGELEQAIQSRLAFGGVAAELLCDDATFERVRAIENA